MFERHSYDDQTAVQPARAKPLPADFDDLLERLAQSAQERRLLRESAGARQG